MNRTITVHNWFNTTDIRVYQANQKADGTWVVEDQDSRITIKGNESSNFDVQYNGIYVTYRPTVFTEEPLGYMRYNEGLVTLDVFDIRAGNMPWGFYASWRGAHVPA